MARYAVTTTRTEMIVYVIEASSPEDAEERYMMDGDEVNSDTTGHYVERVELSGDYYAAAGYPAGTE